MRLLKYLLWGITTREGRDEFFGESESNKLFYRVGSEMHGKFCSKYPEIEVFGAVDNFKGVYQWSNGKQSYCFCIPEDLSLTEAENFVRQRSNGAEFYLWVRRTPDMEIPLLLP